MIEIHLANKSNVFPNRETKKNILCVHFRRKWKRKKEYPRKTCALCIRAWHYSLLTNYGVLAFWNTPLHSIWFFNMALVCLATELTLFQARSKSINDIISYTNRTSTNRTKGTNRSGWWFVKNSSILRRAQTYTISLESYQSVNRPNVCFVHLLLLLFCCTHINE